MPNTMLSMFDSPSPYTNYEIFIIPLQRESEGHRKELVN